MKTAGIIGGIAPESTIQYYRQIVAAYRSRNPDGSYPPVIVNSIDMTKMLDLIGANRLPEVTRYLSDEILKLERAGADFAVLASNTPHVVFAELQDRSPIRLISIVDAARDAARSAGLQCIALLGTRFTMHGQFYPETFEPAGITVIVPDAQEQAYVHDKYMGELVNGIFLPETRGRILDIVRRLRSSALIDGVVLGGTELPLVLPAVEYEGIPFLDTTKLHVARIVDAMLAP